MWKKDQKKNDNGGTSEENNDFVIPLKLFVYIIILLYALNVCSVPILQFPKCPATQKALSLEKRQYIFNVHSAIVNKII